MKEHNHLQRAMDELKTNWPLDHKLIEDEFARLNQINVELQERLDSLKPDLPFAIEALAGCVEAAGICSLGMDSINGGELLLYVEKLQGMLKAGVILPKEADDEMLRAMLAVRWPATYREHLRHPDNGPESKKQNEEEIKVARFQYRAAVKAAVATEPVEPTKPISEVIRDYERAGWHGSSGYHAGLNKAVDIAEQVENGTWVEK